MEYRKFGHKARNHGVCPSMRRQIPTGVVTADFLHHCRKSRHFSLRETPDADWRGPTSTSFIIAENRGDFPSVRRQTPTGEATADSLHHCRKSRRFSLCETSKPAGEATADSLDRCQKIAAFFPTLDAQRQLERPNADSLHHCRKIAALFPR